MKKKKITPGERTLVIMVQYQSDGDPKSEDKLRKVASAWVDAVMLHHTDSYRTPFPATLKEGTYIPAIGKLISMEQR